MSTVAIWRVLSPSVENAPKLLVRARYGDSGYEVELTDLSHVWREIVTKEDIIQRASEVGSSIDPGQDKEQFWIFLSKIESALNGDDGTNLSLHAAGDDGAILSVELSAELPHPLPAFVWTLQLDLQPPLETERLLVTPLLHRANHLRRQIDQLVFELEDKDRVISKVCDRLETSGNDLTTVFPGVSNIKTSRKKGQREQLAKHVKGLADFDYRAWREQHAYRESNESVDDYQLDHVLESLPAPSSVTSSSHANWWRNLNEHPQSDHRTRKGVSSDPCRQHSHSEQSHEADEVMQNEDFQVQSTPPHLKHQTRPEKHAKQSGSPTSRAPDSTVARQLAITGDNNDSETEDEEDLDVPAHKPAASRASPLPPSQPKTVSPSPRKLGVLGGRSTGKHSESVQATPPEAKAVEARPRSKLGKIGGKAKAMEVGPSDPQDPDENEDDDLSSILQTKPTKVGMIGGKLEASRSADHDETGTVDNKDGTAGVEMRSARATAKAESPGPRESSQERADRKRDQLRRELEEKAKAPAKKKRKF